MMNKLTSRGLALALLAAPVAAGCGEDGSNTPPMIDAAPQEDAPPDGPPNPGVVYQQVEHLARPGINEALLITEGFLAGYNATAPTYTGVDPATLNMVVGEAKTVLKAVYLGACLLNGAAGLSAAEGVHPAGIQCHAVGPAIWTEGTLAGVTLTAASQTAAQTYADKVFGQFIPDVMRIDTGVDSNYLTLCGDADAVPLLCGGRRLNDDTIDITYNYLIAGAAIPKGAYNQFNALVSDGVNFSSNDANNSGNAIASTGVNNPQQYHPNVSTTFPYSAPPE
ncbi:MAG TPA: DUF4331 family protein [Kofleriaceae bacterium]|jgi:hypothetical protein|nr:DUF4331 family protein [Kofleriaceae bacterium]